MKISEVIEKLEAIKVECGDLPCYTIEKTFSGNFPFDDVSYVKVQRSKKDDNKLVVGIGDSCPIM